MIKNLEGEFKLSGIVSGGIGNRCGTGQKSFYSVRIFLILKNAMIKIYSDNEKIDPIMSHSNRS